jgi:hypothetical protein
MRLDFDLATQLVLASRLLHLMLEDHLQRNDVFAPLLPGQINVAKFALAERLSDLKVIQTPFFPFCLF